MIHFISESCLRSLRLPPPLVGIWLFINKWTLGDYASDRFTGLVCGIIPSHKDPQRNELGTWPKAWELQTDSSNFSLRSLGTKLNANWRMSISYYLLWCCNLLRPLDTARLLERSSNTNSIEQSKDSVWGPSQFLMTFLVADSYFCMLSKWACISCQMAWSPLHGEPVCSDGPILWMLTV